MLFEGLRHLFGGFRCFLGGVRCLSEAGHRANPSLPKQAAFRSCCRHLEPLQTSVLPFEAREGFAGSFSGLRAGGFGSELPYRGWCCPGSSIVPLTQSGCSISLSFGAVAVCLCPVVFFVPVLRELRKCHRSPKVGGCGASREGLEPNSPAGPTSFALSAVETAAPRLVLQRLEGAGAQPPPAPSPAAQQVPERHEKLSTSRAPRLGSVREAEQSSWPGKRQAPSRPCQTKQATLLLRPQPSAPPLVLAPLSLSVNLCR